MNEIKELNDKLKAIDIQITRLIGDVFRLVQTEPTRDDDYYHSIYNLAEFMDGVGADLVFESDRIIDKVLKKFDELKNEKKGAAK